MCLKGNRWMWKEISRDCWLQRSPVSWNGKGALGTGLHNNVIMSTHIQSPAAKVTFITVGKLLIQNYILTTCDHIPVLALYSSSTTWNCFEGTVCSSFLWFRWCDKSRLFLSYIEWGISDHMSPSNYFKPMGVESVLSGKLLCYLRFMIPETVSPTCKSGSCPLNGFHNGRTCLTLPRKGHPKACR
jgi:hypothetical protein